jgi:hypothetical protein
VLASRRRDTGSANAVQAFSREAEKCAPGRRVKSRLKIKTQNQELERRFDSTETERRQAR